MPVSQARGIRDEVLYTSEDSVVNSRAAGEGLRQRRVWHQEPTLQTNQGVAVPPPGKRADWSVTPALHKVKSSATSPSRWGRVGDEGLDAARPSPYHLSQRESG